MLRLSAATLLGVLMIGCFAAWADPPEDPFAKQLSIQAAMVRARAFLSEMKAQKAVEVLEEQLPKVTANPQYLILLRESYRAYICDLHLAGKSELAKRYLDRLCILDPAAAKDLAQRSRVDSSPPKIEIVPEKKTQFPSWIPASLNPFAKKEQAKSPASGKPSVVRAQAEDTVFEDPFDRKNLRAQPIDLGDPKKARDLMARGMSAFNFKRYADARMSFEEAYRADPDTLKQMCEPWAYCILDGVAKMMDQPGAVPAKLPQMRKQVDQAIQMAPTKVMAVGQQLLAKLEERGTTVGAAPPMPRANAAVVKHLGANKEGWQVAESRHFRVFYRQDRAQAERAAEIAESTRAAMYRKWFGRDSEEWTPICELILHPDAQSYTQMTGAPANSPGHSRIDAPSGRVIARRMDMRLDINSVMQAVLPHETTHIVLAGNFGAHHVPRWADEGIAVLSEPAEKIDQHRRNLLKHHREKQLFALKDLMELNDYPHPRRVGAFYAQSVVLCDFLAKLRGPKVLPQFVKDGLHHGYDKALERHYGMTFAELEQRWQRDVIGPSERVAATK